MPKLFESLTIRGVTARNRTMVSPMCMYMAEQGMANDYHLVHLGRFALGGAGIVMAEATAIEPEGRIAHGDLGLWNDGQGEALARVAAFISEYGAVPGIQLAHAGRKASCRSAAAGGDPLGATDAAAGEPPWQIVGPSALAAGPEWPVPVAWTTEEVEASIDRWASAARRAVQAGFKVIDLHGGHGYLLHSFQSPISNRRIDKFGGNPGGRMAYPLAVVRAVREAIGEDVALFYRISATEGVAGGVGVGESIVFAKELRTAGVDLIDVSSGGVSTDRSVDARVRRGYAFHADLSRDIREGSGMPVATVGLIVDPHQAEAVLDHGEADIVALGREMLENSQWPHHARLALMSDHAAWHDEVRWALELRAAGRARLAHLGETPMTRYDERSNN
ncbi:NADH:flavin oxidoreductase/NADH oxidase [Nocardioides sp. Bht2]|uniref:NADH:flavin oxidoreductase/NADH oxidase n=1 Tax=Nocardioides sp. Bht2 TaxID=3392297 RepID=UPI0039B5C4B5